MLRKKKSTAKAEPKPSKNMAEMKAKRGGMIMKNKAMGLPKKSL